MEEKREVDEELVKKFSEEFKMINFEYSSKNSKDVRKIFSTLVKQIWKGNSFIEELIKEEKKENCSIF